MSEPEAPGKAPPEAGDLELSVAPARASCPVCSEQLARDDVVLCQDCAAPHHHACWRYNKGCGVYGCHSRISSRPLGSRAEEIEFWFRRQISLFSMMTLGSAYMIGLFLFLPVVPPELYEGFFAVLSSLFAACVVALGAPTAVRTRYRLQPRDRTLARTVYLGPLALSHDPAWLDFERVQRLEVRPVQMPRYYRNETGSALEFSLVTDEGHRVPLAPYPWELEDQLQEKAASAAEVLGTTVAFPLALPPGTTLAPGIMGGLATLPAAAEDEEGRPPALPAEGPGG